MAKQLLKDAQKRFVVQALACFLTPKDVAALVKDKYELEVSRQAIECYDPTKVAGLELRAELRQLFQETRTSYIADQQAAALAHKRYRLEVLTRLVQKAEEQSNFRWAAHLIKQAKEEIEGIIPSRPDAGGKHPGKGMPVLRVTFQDGAGTGTASEAAPEAGDSVPE